MSNLASLAVIAGLSLNLILQTGFGINEILIEKEKPVKKSFIHWSANFISVFVLWLFWTFVISPLSLAFFVYFLLFPIVYLISDCIENLLIPVLTKNSTKKKIFSSSFYTYSVIISLLITLKLSSNISEAFVLSFFFAFGAFFAGLVLGAIRKRLSNERISPKLRGMPLLLLSMGLLSVVFSSVAIVLLFR